MSSKYIIYFYFDFLSPYSYLAFKLLFRKFLPAWREAGLEIDLQLKPASLPHIIARSGNSPPGGVPARRTYLLKDLNRGAQYYGVGEFKMPGKFPFDTRKMMMAALESGNVQEFAEQWWSKIFQDGEIDFLDRFQVRNEQGSKAQLMKNTEEALQKGAFGVPYWVIKNQDGLEEGFFGSDRFHYMSAFMGVSQNKL